jgi:hypothetical protein
MKPLMIFAFVFYGMCVQALSAATDSQQKLRMTCTTEPLTTSFTLYEGEDSYTLHLIQHNGVEYMPIYSGTVVPQALPALVRKAEQLKKIGTPAQVTFKKSDCRHKDFYWTCFTQSQPKLGALDVTSIYFSMGLLKSDYEGYAWSSTETFLSLGQKSGTSLTTSMTYQEGACQGYAD